MSTEKPSVELDDEGLCQGCAHYIEPSSVDCDRRVRPVAEKGDGADPGTRPQTRRAHLNDFLRVTGCSHRKFWEIVESHRNEVLFDESFLDSGSVPRPVDDFENVDPADPPAL